MAGNDTMLLEVLTVMGGVASELENLGSKIFNDGSKVN
jgi:hypothetical protein